MGNCVENACEAATVASAPVLPVIPGAPVRANLIDRETLKSVIATVVKILSSVAILSNNDLLKRVSVLVEQIVTKDWFVDLILNIIELFANKAPFGEFEALAKKYIPE